MAEFTVSLSRVIETLKIPRNSWTLTTIAGQENVQMKKINGMWHVTPWGAQRLRKAADSRKAKGYRNGRKVGEPKNEQPELPLSVPAETELTLTKKVDALRALRPGMTREDLVGTLVDKEFTRVQELIHNA